MKNTVKKKHSVFSVCLVVLLLVLLLITVLIILPANFNKGFNKKLNELRAITDSESEELIKIGIEMEKNGEFDLLLPKYEEPLMIKIDEFESEELHQKFLRDYVYIRNFFETYDEKTKNMSKAEEAKYSFEFEKTIAMETSDLNLRFGREKNLESNYAGVSSMLWKARHYWSDNCSTSLYDYYDWATFYSFNTGMKYKKSEEIVSRIFKNSIAYISYLFGDYEGAVEILTGKDYEEVSCKF